MVNELRKTGISIVGDIPWGTHFCSFYETTQDLLDILIPYFKAGLENSEFSLLVISNARELHDEIGQRLTGVGMLLSTVNRHLPSDAAQTQLTDAESLVRDLIE